MNKKRKFNRNQEESTTYIPMDGIGKLPPHIIEMEEAVLGGILLEP
jgi:hypothetical protein